MKTENVNDIIFKFKQNTLQNYYDKYLNDGIRYNRCIKFVLKNRLKLLPAPHAIYYFAIFVVLIMTTIRYFSETTSNTVTFPSIEPYWLALIFELLNVSFISMFHIITHYISLKIGAPTIIATAATLAIYIGYVCAMIYDVESLREYQGRLTMSLLNVYIFRIHSMMKYIKLDYGILPKTDVSPTNESISSFISSIVLSPEHYAVLLVSIFSFIIIGIGIVIFYFDSFAVSFCYGKLKKSLLIELNDYIKSTRSGSDKVNKQNDDETKFIEIKSYEEKESNVSEIPICNEISVSQTQLLEDTILAKVKLDTDLSEANDNEIQCDIHKEKPLFNKKNLTVNNITQHLEKVKLEVLDNLDPNRYNEQSSNNQDDLSLFENKYLMENKQDNLVTEIEKNTRIEPINKFDILKSQWAPWFVRAQIISKQNQDYKFIKKLGNKQNRQRCCKNTHFFEEKDSNLFFRPTSILIEIFTLFYIVLLISVLYAPYNSVIETSVPLASEVAKNLFPVSSKSSSMTSYAEFDIKENYIKSVERIRNLTYLPEDEYFLDTREVPEYPLVSGKIEAFCALKINENDQKCIVLKAKKLSNTKLSENDNINSIDDYPDVALLILESFSPLPRYLDPIAIKKIEKNPSKYILDFSNKNDYLFNPKIHSVLDELAHESIVFTGVASQSLPTLRGWHSLMSNLYPTNDNAMLTQAYTKTDDILSFARLQNFATLYISPSDLDFDGKINWLLRKTGTEEAFANVSKGDINLYNDLIQRFNENRLTTDEQKKYEKYYKKSIKTGTDHEKWCDYIIYDYIGDQNQMNFINSNIGTNLAKPKIPRSWMPDRITSALYKLYYNILSDDVNDTTNENYNKQKFTVWMNVDTHTPFTGFDDPEYYTKIVPNNDITELFNQVNNQIGNNYKCNYFKTSSYSMSEQTQNKNYDVMSKALNIYGLKPVLDQIKGKNKNTIVFIVGDHGARTVSAASSLECEFYENGETMHVYPNKSCYHQKTNYSTTSFGHDQMFTTTAMISYLGDNENIKKYLFGDSLELKGRVVNLPADHFDLIKTMKNIFKKYSKKSSETIGTLAYGRDLIQLSKDANSMTEYDFISKYEKYFSYSSTMTNYEIRGIDYLLRANYFSTSDSILFKKNTNSNIYDDIKQLSFPTCFLTENISTKNSLSDRSEKLLDTIKGSSSKVEKDKLVEDVRFYQRFYTYLADHNRLFNYNFRHLSDSSTRKKFVTTNNVNDNNSYMKDSAPKSAEKLESVNGLEFDSPVGHKRKYLSFCLILVLVLVCSVVFIAVIVFSLITLVCHSRANMKLKTLARMRQIEEYIKETQDNDQNNH